MLGVAVEAPSRPQISRRWFEESKVRLLDDTEGIVMDDNTLQDWGHAVEDFKCGRKDPEGRITSPCPDKRVIDLERTGESTKMDLSEAEKEGSASDSDFIEVADRFRHLRVKPNNKKNPLRDLAFKEMIDDEASDRLVRYHTRASKQHRSKTFGEVWTPKYPFEPKFNEGKARRLAEYTERFELATTYSRMNKQEKDLSSQSSGYLSVFPCSLR